MIKYLIFAFLLLNTALVAQSDQIQWMSFTEAMEKAKTQPKKIFIDMYTDWCGWCKRMDATTFQHPEVIKYMNEHYYAVKFNAEKEGPITVNDTTYNLNPSRGRNGTHDLAIILMNGKLSYPTFVFLDERFNILSPLPGYQQVNQIEAPLKYFGDNLHQKQSWQEYNATFTNFWK